MDEFKKYIKDHREELDVEIPPAIQIWNSKSDDRQRLPIAIRWMVAAGLLLILSGSLYWGIRTALDKNLPEARIINKDSNKGQKIQTDSLTIIPPPAVTGADTKNDLAIHEEQKEEEPLKRTAITIHKPKSRFKSGYFPPQSLEANYASVVNYQLKRLERIPIYAESADYFHVFKKQWYDMAKDEEKIKEDIHVYGLNDILVGQVIQLYQQKISLLKQLQTEITKMNNRARNNPELRKQTPTYFKM